MASLLNRSLGDVRKSRDLAPPLSKPLFGKSRSNQASDHWKHDLFDGVPAVAQPQDVPDDTRSPALLITNLHYDVSEAELKALFSQIGKIDRGPTIKFDHSGRATEGLAFVSYESDRDAAEAIKAFNGACAKGQPINLKYEFGMPMWVRGSLGMFNRKDTVSTIGSSGLLGRIQEDRSDRRHASSPYDNDRSRYSRSYVPTPSSGGARGPISRDFRLPRGPALSSSVGSIRGARDSGRDRGGLDRSRGRPTGMKSAMELDKELEAFMKTPSSKTAVNTKNGDVQMAD